MRIHMRTAAVGPMALNGLPKFLQLLIVIGNDLLGSIVGEELGRHDFELKAWKRKIDVATLLVIAAVFDSRLGARIHAQTGVANVHLLADMQVSHGRFDVDVLRALIVFILVDVDAARGQHAKHGKQRAHRQSAGYVRAEAHVMVELIIEHGQNLLKPAGRGVPGPRLGLLRPES